MLVPMARVEIIGPKSKFFDVVTLLHEQGTLQLQDLSKQIGAGELPVDQMEIMSGKQAERENLEDLLIRVRAILRTLHQPITKVDAEQRQQYYRRLWKFDGQALADEIAGVMDEVEDKTSSLAQTQVDIESELVLLARYAPILHKIQPLAAQIVATGAFESVALLVERRYKGALDQLKEELNRITHNQCEIVSIDVDEDTTAAIAIFNKTYSEPVHKLLDMENVNQIRLPSDLEGMPFDAAYSTIVERREALPKQLDEVRKQLETISAQWYMRLATIRDVLSDKLEEIAAIPKFGQTGYAFVITGWVPVVDIPQLSKAVLTQFGSDIVINQLEISEKDFDETPVAFKNAKVMQPFEKLLSVYGLPRYGTIDVTWMLFVFYPLFFGMIVGDIGYGLIMLGIILWLRFSKRDNPTVQLATSVLGPAATMVIVFGFLYGEFFGNVLGPEYLNWIRVVQVGPLTLPFVREQAVVVFGYIVLVVGAVHIVMGLVFGVVNALRTKAKHHLYEKGGILTVVLAVFIAVGLGQAEVLFGNWAVWGQTAFAILALVAFIWVLRWGGVLGAVETLESFAGMMSYIRIMAVGLAGAIFANAANQIMRETGNIAAAIVVGVLLHGLNFAIAAFSPTIHAIRLNFLEFFGKFYETGSKAYNPFQKTGGEKSA